MAFEVRHVSPLI